MRLPVAVRLALRELRGGLSGFRVFLLCLALGVAAIAAVGSVRAAVDRGLAREAASLLGGDAEIEFTYRFASHAERDWMDRHAGAVSEIVDFRSLLAMPPPAAGEPQRALVMVKAVDAGYPLVGSVVLAGGGGLAAALAPHDGLPGLVAEKGLADRWGLLPGAVVRLGETDFRLTGIVLSVPDAGAGFTALAPRVIVRKADLAASGLLGEGSMFDSSYRLQLAPGADLTALRADAVARFGDSGLQWRDRRAGAPGIGRFVDRLGSFLVLVGLAGLAVGGIGVAAAVRAHLEEKTATIATLKTLGATGATVFAVYLVETGILAALGIAAGLVLGTALPLVAAPAARALLPVPAEFGLYPRPLLEAALYGGLTAFLFTVWPLARARDIRAAELYRDLTAARRTWPRRSYVVATGVLAAVLVGAAALFSGAPELALGAAGGVAAALLVLVAAAAGLQWLARRLGRGGASRGRPALRWALAALGGPSGETASVVLALGLGLSVLAAIGQIDWNLRALVGRDLPARAPAFFFIDIQGDELDGFLATARRAQGVGAIETAPMLRGIIVKINGRPAKEVAGSHWALSGDRGISFAAAPPPGTVITAGNWWPADYAGPPLMSFGAEQAREMGLKLGDTVTVNILGRDITATIASLREVRFETMGINFLMILDPAALAGAPSTHIATVYAAPEAEAPLLAAIGDTFPNVTGIGVRETIGRVASALGEVAAATRWAAAATLSTGLVVLVGAAAAGERRRAYEAAVLKTIGADRRTILASFALRAALVGAAAGLVAVAAGGLAGWVVTRFVLEGDFRFALGNALAIVAGGALASLVAGLAFALRPLSARPARVLRAVE
ncbi:MAG: FtsX-like permease family protein [Amaricoccus sp.]